MSMMSYSGIRGCRLHGLTDKGLFIRAWFAGDQGPTVIMPYGTSGVALTGWLTRQLSGSPPNWRTDPSCDKPSTAPSPALRPKGLQQPRGGWRLPAPPPNPWRTLSLVGHRRPSRATQWRWTIRKFICIWLLVRVMHITMTLLILCRGMSLRTRTASLPVQMG